MIKEILLMQTESNMPSTANVMQLQCILILFAELNIIMYTLMIASYIQ